MKNSEPPARRGPAGRSALKSVRRWWGAWVVLAMLVAVAALTFPACPSLQVAGTGSDEASPKQPQRMVSSTATAQEDEDISAPRDDLAGLPNFARVSERLYRGGQPTREGFRRLKEMGVKTIVNLRTLHSDEDLIEGMNFEYVHIRSQAWDVDEDEVIDFMNVATDADYAPVFVHCEHGSDRTGLMVAVYQMVVQDWPREKALAELERFGYHRIWRGIRTYIENLDPERIEHAIGHDPPPDHGE